MQILRNIQKLFLNSEVDAIVGELQSGDPDWNYVAVKAPDDNGFAFIEIYDETNDFVGHYS